MSHTLNPTVTVLLDKERKLLYGAAAFIEFKDATGRDLLRTFAGLSDQFSSARDEDGNQNPNFELPLKEFRDILWAGLIHEDEQLTLKQTSNLFTVGMLAELLPIVLEAFTLGLGQQQEKPDRPQMAPVRRKRSTGAVSGALHASTSG